MLEEGGGTERTCLQIVRLFSGDDFLSPVLESPHS